MRRDWLRILGVELVPAFLYKDQRVTVAPHAQDTFHTYMFFRLQVPEPLADLFDDSLYTRRVPALYNFAGPLWILVFNDHASIFRVNAPSSKAVFMPAFDGQTCFSDKLIDKPVALMTNVFLRSGPFDSFHHLLSHYLGVVFNQCFEVFIHGLFRYQKISSQ